MKIYASVHVFALICILAIQRCNASHIASCGYIKGSDEYYYRFEHQYKSWGDAKAVCESENATLASFSSDATYQFISKTYCFRHKIWLGAKTNGHDWEWLDGTPIIQKYREQGGHHHVTGDCGMLQNDHLIAPAYCGEKKTFLCQKKESGCLHSTSAVSTCGKMTVNVTCKPYHCFKDKVQHYGTDISYRRTDTLKDCATYCCAVPTTESCNCLGFDWTSETQRCALISNSKWDDKSLVGNKGVYSCEMRDLPNGYVKGHTDSYFVKLYAQKLSWKAALEVCKEEGAGLADADDIDKKYFLNTTLGQQLFWTKRECTLLDSSHGNNPVQKPCEDLNPFVCEYATETITIEEGEDSQEYLKYIWAGLGALGVLLGGTIRMFCYIRARKALKKKPLLVKSKESRSDAASKVASKSQLEYIPENDYVESSSAAKPSNSK